MKTNQETAEILNDLVQINNDRIVGYEKAMEELNYQDRDLKSIFLSMIDKSRSYQLALSTELNVLGSETNENNTTSGKIYIAWMNVKAVFIGHDRKAVLSSCEFGEDTAQKAYQMALDDEGLTVYFRTLISEQKYSLRLAQDQIKALRDQQA